MKRLVFLLVLFFICITGYAEYYSNLNMQKIEELLVGGWECHRFFKGGEYSHYMFSGFWRLSGETLYIQTSDFNRDIIVHIWQIEKISADTITFRVYGKQQTLKKTESDLILAVVKKDIEQVKNLIAQGRDVNIKSICSEVMADSLLSWLILNKSGNANIILKMLLDAGADPDLTIGVKTDLEKIDDTYTTPLMRAAWLNNLAAARILLDAGADIHKQDKEGKTALDIAREHGNTEMIELLRNAK